MKLKKDFITHDTGRQSMLVPVGTAGFSGLVKGNRTLGVILSLLKEDTTEAEIVAAMKARFDAPEEKVRADVQKALSALRKIDALRD